MLGALIETVCGPFENKDSVLQGLVVILEDGVGLEGVHLGEITVIVNAPEIRVNLCDCLLQVTDIQTTPVRGEDMTREG